jgi:hypothetical protein
VDTTNNEVWKERIGKLAAELRVQEQELAQAIGLLVIHFNRLEIALGTCLGDLLEAEDHHTKHALVASMSFGQKLDLLAALYIEKYKGDEFQRSRCKLAVQNMQWFEAERNKYVHSCWGARTFGDPRYIRVKPQTRGGKGLKVTEEQAMPAAIIDVCERIRTFCWLDLVELSRGCVSGQREGEQS